VLEVVVEVVVVVVVEVVVVAPVPVVAVVAGAPPDPPVLLVAPFTLPQPIAATVPTASHQVRTKVILGF
jgi:hypothetical protein